MSRNFLDFAKTGLQKARQLGADSAELFIVKNQCQHLLQEWQHICTKTVCQQIIEDMNICIKR